MTSPSGIASTPSRSCPADPDTFYWILLQRLGVSAAVVRRLCRSRKEPDAEGVAEHWLRARPAKLAALGVPATAREQIAEWQRLGASHRAAVQAQQDGDWLVRHQAQLLHLCHPAYPALLRETADPPPWLYIAGDAALLDRPQLAIVGSRRPSRQGVEDAGAFAGALAGAGFTITSGLAYGIDAAAHRAALGTLGSTVAVLGTGLDRIYPARHAALTAEILAQGTLVTEQPLGAAPLPGNFPRRNRIISGLSLGVLVVEAALRSGSLVTARLALEQNREVFALPGSIHNPAARGTNSLIRQGATLVQTVADICQELSGWLDSMSEGDCAAAGLEVARRDDAHPLLDAIDFEPTSLDLIAERSGLPIPAVLGALAELELDGRVAMEVGGWSRLARRPPLR